MNRPHGLVALDSLRSRLLPSVTINSVVSFNTAGARMISCMSTRLAETWGGEVIILKKERFVVLVRDVSTEMC